MLEKYRELLKPKRRGKADYIDDIRNTSFIELMFLLVFALLVVLAGGFKTLSWASLNQGEKEESQSVDPNAPIKSMLTEWKERVDKAERAAKDLIDENSALSSRLAEASKAETSAQNLQSELNRLRAEREATARQLGLQDAFDQSRNLSDAVRIKTEADRAKIEKLEKRLAQVGGETGNLRRGGGLDTQPCWRREGEGSGRRVDFLYSIVIQRSGHVRLERAWPPRRQQEVDSNPILSSLDGLVLTRAEFQRRSLPIREFADRQTCSHHVLLRSETGMLPQDLMSAIGNRFYITLH